MEQKTVLSGYGIVVLDRGFVYVGQVECSSEWCVIRGARNIRAWGTTKGLGELAQNGATPKTILDMVGTLHAPMRAVISILDTEEAKWKI